MKLSLLTVTGMGLVLHAAANSPIEGDLVQFVHPEIGCANTRNPEDACYISNGNLYPITARPWGFGGFSPMTRPDGTSRWFYDYNDDRICGIRYTRQPSPWAGDHGAWSFMPVIGEIDGDAKKRMSWYSHKSEHFGPDRYSIYFSDFETTAEITPSLHGAIVRITYPQTEKPALVVSAFKGGDVLLHPDGRSIHGFSALNKNWRGWGAPVKCRFVMVLSRPAIASKKLSDGSLAIIFAPTKRNDRLEMRLAVSMISDEQAVVNLKETEGISFDSLAADARKEWNDRLSRIKVESSDPLKKTTFYSCFFRTMLFPLALWERTADGKIVHWSPSTGKTMPGYYYAGTGFWDTFRALFPLVNFLAPEINARMTEGLQHCWNESGWLPEWSNPGLSNCMIGNHSASVVADAWLSGVRGNFDINELWKALVHGANNSHPNPKLQAVGREGAKQYNELGYIPRNIGIRNSTSKTLEYAYDDWCLATLAKAIERPQSEIDLYLKRSQNWRNVFDPKRKITVGRNADGTFKADFNACDWDNDFIEGCAHHYTWSVFHDVQGLIAAMGGNREFKRRLEAIFTIPTISGRSSLHGETHEAREMRIANFGQYAHGNQPIQHAIYLFDWCDAWDRAQYWSREVMERLYLPTPDGYCGDEDNGQTSAWYVWSAMGMYPVCPGSGEYALGAPLFDRIVVSLPYHKTLTIESNGACSRRKFTKAAFNGRQLSRPFVMRDELSTGGCLTFNE